MAPVPSPCDERPRVKLHTFLHLLFSLCVQQDEACLTICFSKLRYLLAEHHLSSQEHHSKWHLPAVRSQRLMGIKTCSLQICRHSLYTLLSAQGKVEVLTRTLPSMYHFYEQQTLTLGIRGQARNRFSIMSICGTCGWGKNIAQSPRGSVLHSDHRWEEREKNLMTFPNLCPFHQEWGVRGLTAFLWFTRLAHLP